jgi:hypothetical protein
MSIVVDTSVVRAIGKPESKDAHAVACRRCLEAILDRRIVLAMSNEMLAEWKKQRADGKTHMSPAASSWLSQMMGRKLVVRLKPPQDATLCECGEQQLTEQGWQVLEKDLHLFDLAFATDYRVLSAEDKCWLQAQKLFGCAPMLKKIVWAYTRGIEVSVLLDWIVADMPDPPAWPR